MKSDLSGLKVGDPMLFSRGDTVYRMKVTSVGKKWLRACYENNRSWGVVEFEIATGIAHADAKHTKRKPSMGFASEAARNRALEREKEEAEIMELLRLGWRLKPGVEKLWPNDIFELLNALRQAKNYAGL